MPQRNYSFMDIMCVLDGIKSYGFSGANDDIIIERIEDVSTMKQGSDNWATISKNAAQGVKVTLKLLDTSPYNQVLQSVLTTMDATGQVIPIPMYFKDLGGLDLFQCDTLVIAKQPSAPYGKESNIRQWELHGIPTIWNLGGHPIF